MSHRTWFVVLFSLVVVLPSIPEAQVCRDDRLQGGPCCTVAQPDIPYLRSFSQDSLDICWRDCDVENFSACKVRWIFKPQFQQGTVPNPCEPQFGRLRIRDASGAVKWRAGLAAQYSRTWNEVDAAGNQVQVWRFLVNGDLRPTPAAGLTPCPVPTCAAAFNNRVRFTGYLDRAQNCTTGSVEHAWMLNHSCDVVDHAPGFPRGGFFHPNRAYTFVGPAAGFALGPLQPVASGGTTLESVRRVRQPVPGTTSTWACEYEEQIDCGLQLQQELCLCGFPTGLQQYAISDLGLASACGTSITTPGGPFLPGYLSMGIGSWTDPTTYPGLERLRWTTGGYDYFDPCLGVTRQEIFFGVTTLGGNFASSVGPFGGFPLPLEFVDQSNSLRGGATTMNRPFLSDHFLGLNF